jgi:hypothetical protein
MPARSRIDAVRGPWEHVIPAAVAAVGAASLAAKGLLLPVNRYDAGISASAGTFILHGLVPFRNAREGRTALAVASDSRG